MASTNKTPKLGLNQWAAGDEVLRADFNADNAKIDAQLLTSACKVGSYVGDNTVNRNIDVGFAPSLVILLGCNSHLAFASSRSDFLDVTNSVSYQKPGANSQVRTTSNGFIVLDMSFNPMGSTPTYIAFR